MNTKAVIKKINDITATIEEIKKEVCKSDVKLIDAMNCLINRKKAERRGMIEALELMGFKVNCELDNTYTATAA